MLKDRSEFIVVVFKTTIGQKSETQTRTVCSPSKATKTKNMSRQKKTREKRQSFMFVVGLTGSAAHFPFAGRSSNQMFGRFQTSAVLGKELDPENS